MFIKRIVAIFLAIQIVVLSACGPVGGLQEISSSMDSATPESTEEAQSEPQASAPSAADPVTTPEPQETEAQPQEEREPDDKVLEEAPKLPDLSGIDSLEYPDMMVTGLNTTLGLRTSAIKSDNEIGQLENGSRVHVIERTTDEFWCVYSRSLQKYGFVNSDYLTDALMVSDASSSARHEAIVGDIDVHVPEIHLHNPVCHELNLEIDDALAMTPSELSECMGVVYTWGVNHGILSLVVETKYMNDYRTFSVYNVSVSDGTLVSKDQIMADCGYTEESYYQRCREVLADYILETFDAVPGEGPDDEQQDYIDRSAAEDNISAFEPYISEQGHLCVSGRFFFPAGGGKHNAVFDLESGEVIFDIDLVESFSDLNPASEEPKYEHEEEPDYTVVSEKYIVNISGSLDMEDSPDDPNSTVLAILTLNTKVGFVKEVDEHWSLIEYEGQFGYVLSKYLSDEMQLDSFAPTENWPDREYLVMLDSLYWPYQSPYYVSDVRILMEDGDGYMPVESGKICWSEYAEIIIPDYIYGGPITESVSDLFLNLGYHLEGNDYSVLRVTMNNNLAVSAVYVDNIKSR